MATKAQVSAEEYLKMSFDGADREFLDGEIVERNVGENPHSKVQLRLILLLDKLSVRSPLHIRPELRVRVRPTRYRVADLAIWAGKEPTENVPSAPPLVTIEIISRDDRHTEIIQKLEEYLQWGVARVWLVDPWLRKLYVFSNTGLSEIAAFELPAFEAKTPASDIFA